MKKNLKILQIASYNGNIGDNANIIGTRKYLSKNLDFKLEFTNLEIREFFWKERNFDMEFANYVNNFDLFIFGGGNFFELWVDSSCNNTTVDIDIEILKIIKTPTIFYALGMDDGMGVLNSGINKFKTWLDYVIKQDRFILSVRNDGSLDAAKKYLGNNYAKHFYKVPDGGFFTTVKSFNHVEIPKDKTIIGMNLAGDMLDKRFNINEGHISFDNFMSEFSELFNNLFTQNNNLHLLLFPHIYKDLGIIYQFLSKINDKYARNNVSVFPYISGFEAQNYIFDAYKKCDLVMGNRFHTSVCSIGLNIPSIGFINYPQIEKLYNELNMPERSIKINNNGFSKDLKLLINNSLKDKTNIKMKYKDIKIKLNSDINTFHKHINKWLNKIYN